MTVLHSWFMMYSGAAGAGILAVLSILQVKLHMMELTWGVDFEFKCDIFYSRMLHFYIYVLGL